MSNIVHSGKGYEDRIYSITTDGLIAGVIPNCTTVIYRINLSTGKWSIREEKSDVSDCLSRLKLTDG
ncbi:MAG: hypothetical protein PHG66_00930 [Candidatus Colwellbacteria bacterium]|nr:hypothetical protein [Candidatus Colwellbacteria bacterium]